MLMVGVGLGDSDVVLVPLLVLVLDDVEVWELVLVLVSVLDDVEVWELVLVAEEVDVDVDVSLLVEVVEMVGVTLGEQLWTCHRGHRGRGHSLCSRCTARHPQPSLSRALTSVNAQSLPPEAAVEPAQNAIDTHGELTLKLAARFTAAGRRVYLHQGTKAWSHWARQGQREEPANSRRASACALKVEDAYGDTENSRSAIELAGPSLAALNLEDTWDRAQTPRRRSCLCASQAWQAPYPRVGHSWRACNGCPVDIQKFLRPRACTSSRRVAVTSNA